MYKRIICPVDFSPSSLSGVEYASNLAKLFSAELLLVNVQPILQSELAGPGAGTLGILKESLSEAKQQLAGIAKETESTFNISCECEVDVTLRDFDKIVESLTGKDDLVVMGTNGADDLYQFFFGSNAYHVLKRVKAPVIVVPEKLAYAKFSKLVFALTYEKGSKESLPLAKDIADSLSASIDILHVSKSETKVSREIFKSLDTFIDDLFKESADFNYQQVFSDDAVKSINEYMEKQVNALLMVYARELNLFEKLFDKKIIKKICDDALYPIMVVHEQ